MSERCQCGEDHSEQPPMSPASVVYPEDDNPTARTIRLIKAQALRDAVALFKERFEGKARVVQPGYLTAEYELTAMAEELEK